MNKILIVEDDPAIQALLHDFLSEAGYDVALASDGVEALATYSERQFDLILLDIMLPKIDGYGVCSVIRRKSDVPIIMLTALDGERDQIKGLDLQVDDYMTKPFSMPILIRKIAAVLRRSAKQRELPQTISYKNLTLDLDGYKAYTGEGRIDLTPLPRCFCFGRSAAASKGAGQPSGKRRRVLPGGEPHHRKAVERQRKIHD